jgi:hypothetical protein
MLIGLWRVADAQGEPAGTVLRLAGDDGFGVIVFRSCGQLFGNWIAGNGGAFVAMTDGSSGDCAPAAALTPTWLARARTFRVRGAERDLLTSNASVVARLLPGGRPAPSSGLDPSFRQPPTPSPATVRTLRTSPRPLPAGTTPATPSTLLGTWVPYPVRRYGNAAKPSLTFSADGSWVGSDGCNGFGGRWALAGGGEILSVSGPSTLIGCDGAPTGSWLTTARRAAISGDRLSLYAADGRAVAQLTR